MSSPTGADVCHHCGERPVKKWIKATPPGVVNVELALCNCDWPRCRNVQCRKVLRDVPMNVHACPHCRQRL